MTVIAVAALLVLIAVGVALIHRLNVQHDERIAAFHYSDALPGVGRRTRRRRRAAGAATVPARPTATAIADDTGFGPTGDGRGRRVMAILRERKAYREKIMRALHQAAEGNRLLGVDGAKLRNDLGIPERDLAAACVYLADKGWVVIDRGRDDTSATIRLTPQGIRRMEAEEEECDGAASTDAVRPQGVRPVPKDRRTP
ncbi:MULTISPECIES: hypothetical protein [Streptomyces]|jgi:hypothetical protein|uniref:hypothetical protein n=1 Tax=Streptomyces TaxID=1883 RepID=UPI00082EBD01|nr:hypothetical protein [Streptomyces sp. F-3]